jgi:hypothetical protein
MDGLAVAAQAHPASPALPDGERLFRPLARRELAGAMVLCALAVALFLSPALLTGRMLSPADLLFDHYPWHVAAPAGSPGPSNGLLTDSVFQFEPWLAFSVQRLHAGALPLWNPDAMLGAPFFGNMQSAIFYPGNWLYFLWPDALTLALRAGIKLFLAALGMYLLARQVLRVGPVAAALAAVAFTFGAFMTVWLLYSQTSVVALLPWCWWATARLLARPGPRGVALLAGLVALALFAGQPQAVVHLALATGLFALWLIVWIRPRRPARMLRDAALWAGAWGLGAAAGAIQMLPFVEYTSLSWAALLRTSLHVLSSTPPLPFAYVWTLFSPDLYGNPAQHTGWGPINYNESNTYIGILPLILVPCAWLAGDRLQRSLRWFLLVLVLLAVAVVYRAPVVQSLVDAVPVLDVAQNQRLLLVVQFALALLAALGAEALPASLAAGWRRPALMLTGGVLGVLGLGVVVPWVLAHGYFQVPPAAAYPQPLRLWQSSLLRSVAWLLAGSLVLGLVVGLWRARPRLARGLFALLPLVLAADLWAVHGNYNPTVAAQDYYPATAVTRFLQQQPGVFRSVGLDWTLMPNTGMFYGLADLGGYDSLEPRLYHDLAAQLDPTRGTRINPDPFHHIQSPLLNLLNVRYVVAPPGTDPNYVTDVAPNINADQVTAAIEGAAQVGQTFVSQQAGLTQITVQVSTLGRQPAGTVRFHLKTTPAAATDLVAQTLDTRDLTDGGSWTIQFPPLPQTRGQALYFYFEPVDVPSGHGVGLRYQTHEGYPQGTRIDGGRPAGGDLAFATTVLLDQTDPWFVRVLDGGASAASVFENRRVLPRAWLAHQVDVLSTPKAVRLHLSDAGFDAVATALVSSPLPAGDSLPAQAPPAGADVVNITQYAPEAVTINTQSRAAGVLMLSDEAFPGWQAQVDGVPVAIMTVDYGLRGIYLPAGTHRVSFIYAPESFRLGAEISGAAILLVGMLVGAPWIFGQWRAGRRAEKSAA